MKNSKLVKSLAIFAICIISIFWFNINSYAKYFITQNLKVAKINIDITSPKVEVDYQKTESITIVTITANEEIKEVEGWILKNDKKTLTKEYEETVKEKINIQDIYGNITQIEINT